MVDNVGGFLNKYLQQLKSGVKLNQVQDNNVQKFFFQQIDTNQNDQLNRKEVKLLKKAKEFTPEERAKFIEAHPELADLKDDIVSIVSIGKDPEKVHVSIKNKGDDEPSSFLVYEKDAYDSYELKEKHKFINDVEIITKFGENNTKTVSKGSITDTYDEFGNISKREVDKGLGGIETVNYEYGEDGVINRIVTVSPSETETVQTENLAKPVPLDAEPTSAEFFDEFDEGITSDSSVTPDSPENSTDTPVVQVKYSVSTTSTPATAENSSEFSLSQSGVSSEPFEDPSESSNTLPEPSGVPSEPFEVPSEPPNVPSEPSEVSPEPSEVSPEPSEVPSEPSEVPPEPSEVSPEPSEVPPEPSKVPSEPSPTPTKPDAKPGETTNDAPSPAKNEETIDDTVKQPRLEKDTQEYEIPIEADKNAAELKGSIPGEEIDKSDNDIKVSSKEPDINIASDNIDEAKGEVNAAASERKTEERTLDKNTSWWMLAKQSLVDSGIKNPTYAQIYARIDELVALNPGKEPAKGTSLRFPKENPISEISPVLTDANLLEQPDVLSQQGNVTSKSGANTSNPSMGASAHLSSQIPADSSEMEETEFLDVQNGEAHDEIAKYPSLKRNHLGHKKFDNRNIASSLRRKYESNTEAKTSNTTKIKVNPKTNSFDTYAEEAVYVVPEHHHAETAINKGKSRTVELTHDTEWRIIARQNLIDCGFPNPTSAQIQAKVGELVALNENKEPTKGTKIELPSAQSLTSAAATPVESSAESSMNGENNPADDSSNNSEQENSKEKSSGENNSSDEEV